MNKYDKFVHFKTILSIWSNQVKSLVTSCQNSVLQHFFGMIKHLDNNEIKSLTVEQLKQFDGFAHLSDEELLNTIKTLKQISLLTHNIVNSHERLKRIPKLCKAE